MNLNPNEVLFYCGLVITGITVVAAVIFFCVSGISRQHLNEKLDEEYGKTDARKR